MHSEFQANRVHFSDDIHQNSKGPNKACLEWHPHMGVDPEQLLFPRPFGVSFVGSIFVDVAAEISRSVALVKCQCDDFLLVTWIGDQSMSMRFRASVGHVSSKPQGCFIQLHNLLDFEFCYTFIL